MRRGGIFDCMSWPEGPIPLLATPALLAPRHRGGGNARVHHAVALVASGVDPAAFAMGTGADRTVCACSLSNRLIGPAASTAVGLRRDCPAVTIVASSVNRAAFRRRSNAPNCGAWPRTRFTQRRRTATRAAGPPRRREASAALTTALTSANHAQ
jgi:hypothetical protein